MSSLKELKAEAKAADIEGYSALNKAQLEGALGYTTDEEAGPQEAAPAPLVGVPTRSDAWIAANLTEAELETAIIAGEAAAPDTAAAVKNLGVPTEPEKAGEGPPAQPAPRPPSTPPPSHSGADIEAGIGIPTEPDNGGLNATEIRLSGATGNTAAGKAAAKKRIGDEKAAKKAAKAESKAKTTEPKKAANKTT